MSYIEIKNIKKSFDGKEILKDVSLSIEKGDFVTFLGPSGCGKTTLLRCIVGLETVDSGTIRLADQDITHLPANQRGVSMIFQQSCLIPTMNIFDNISFGLRMKKMPKNEIEDRIRDVVRMVNLEDHLNKYPYQLSGGEQQRASLARGLVMNPKVLLLDEPFSAIDAKLRKELQIYLKRIHRELNMTSVFVTHDQEEAMRMSDTIHLFNDGIIEQSGSPREIYLHPKTVYAAGFIGSYNLVPSELFGCSGLTYAIRPEVIHASKTESPAAVSEFRLEGNVVDLIPQGSITRVVVRVNEMISLNIDTVSMDSLEFNYDDHVYLTIPKANVEILTR